MKFEIIDNSELDLAGKGYKWVNEPSQVDQVVLDDIRRTRGENYVDGLSDDLLDGYSPICRGDDGELYSVLFDYGGDVPRPVIWSKVTAFSKSSRSAALTARSAITTSTSSFLTAADGRSLLILSV